MYTTTNETGEKVTFSGKAENINQWDAYRVAIQTSLYNYSAVLVEKDGTVVAYAENGWVVESSELVAAKVAA